MSTSVNNALLQERQARLSTPRTIGSRLRDAFREPHPFARNPAHLQPAPFPWLLYVKRTLRTASVLAPLAVVVFGWPFAAKWMVNLSNRVGDYSTVPVKKVVEEERPRSHKIARRAMLQEGPVKGLEAP